MIIHIGLTLNVKYVFFYSCSNVTCIFFFISLKSVLTVFCQNVKKSLKLLNVLEIKIVYFILYFSEFYYKNMPNFTYYNQNLWDDFKYVFYFFDLFALVLRKTNQSLILNINTCKILYS